MKKEFESSTVNESSVFEPLRLYCNEISSGGHVAPNIATQEND